MADSTNQVGQFVTQNQTSPGGHSYTVSGYLRADGTLSGTAPGAAPTTANASDTTADSPLNPGYKGGPQPITNSNTPSSAPIAPPADATNTPVSTDTPNPNTVNATPYTGATNPSAQPTASATVPSAGSATQQAHAAVVSGGTPAPQNAGAGMSAATTALGAANQSQGYTPAPPVVQAYTDAVKKQTDDYAKAMSSQSQGESLVQQYQDFTNQLGIPALNTQLMNMKNIIDGTEQDIRNEVTKAGGFATDSQVLAMTNARNKTMIQNYNNLLQTRSDMQAQVTTMVGLAAQDRTFANQQIDRQLNFDEKQVEFADKALTNAQSSIQKSIDTYGAASVYKQALATGDPTAVARINATIGGGFDLKTAASKPTLDEQLKQAQIASANRANRTNLQFVQGTANQPSGTFNPETGVFTPTTGSVKNTQQLATTQANIESINGLLKPGAMSGVGTNAAFRYDPLTGFTGKQQNFLAGVNQIKDQLTLDSLTKAKQNGATFGALSDGERDVLSHSASKLGSWEVKDKSGNVVGYNASPADFSAELNKINNYAKLDYVLKGGDAASVGVQQLGDGSYWTKNSDNTYTKIQ